MALLSISGILGRFHPLLVHLPIGILLVAIILHWLSRREAFNGVRPAVRITLLLGAVSAVFSCISGWLLASGGEYDAAILEPHRWLGIAVATIAILYYLLYSRNGSLRILPVLPYALSVVLFLLITLAGHLGGTLTHGEGYLTQEWGESADAKEIVKIIPNVQEANVFDDIIQPVLQNKCYSCHGASKQKGKLRLDSKEAILKGGEDGSVLAAGKAGESEMYQRLTLDMLEKKHMPPKGKSQPTEAEIALIHWWINTGATFDQQVKLLPQDDKIKPLLLALQSDHHSKPSLPDIPQNPVNEAPVPAVLKLQEKGATVVPVSAESHYLSVNFIDTTAVDDEAMKLLEPLAPQLVWLKLGNTSVTDSGLTTIGKMPALIKLGLEHTLVSDKGIEKLTSLSGLQYLNLTGTKVTAQGVLQLKHLAALQSIYLYQTNVTTADWPLLKQSFPKTVIDTGGYHLPILEGDTSRVTQKK